jgi:ribonuclease BN (tRNA processing enzyme)
LHLKFVGTSSGKTSLKRNHSSFLISDEDHNLLVDCGDGISSALLKQDINCNSINSILISHLHADHYTGLASLITQMKLRERDDPLTVYIHSSLRDAVEEFLLRSYLFRAKMDFKLNVISIEFDEKVKVSEHLFFTAKQNSHLDGYKPYDINHVLSFASASFLFSDLNNKIIYSGDIGSVNDLFLFNQKIDFLITEISHISSDEILEVYNKIQPNKMILTHIDDEVEELLKTFINSLESDQKSNFLIAEDGLSLNLLKK